MSRLFRYLMIKNGDVVAIETRNVLKSIVNEFKVFDYRDYLFDEDLDIYVFVKDLSYYDDNHTVYYYYGDDLIETFNGTVIFARMVENGFRTLSKNDIELINNHLSRIDRNSFKLNYFANNVNNF